MVTPSERVFKLWQSISPDWCDQSPNSLQNIVPGCFSFDLTLQYLKFVHCMMRKCTFYFDLCNFHQRTVSRTLRDFLMFSIDKDFAKQRPKAKQSQAIWPCLVLFIIIIIYWSTNYYYSCSYRSVHFRNIHSKPEEKISYFGVEKLTKWTENFFQVSIWVKSYSLLERDVLSMYVCMYVLHQL